MSVIPAVKPLIGDEERAAVDAVLTTGVLAQGPQVSAFEREFSTRVDDRQCVAVNSGTSALHMTLIALGVGVGDEVIVPSFTFAATANAVALSGATPVFADIEPSSFCLAPEAISDAISPRTRAVIPVHLFGHPAAMDQIVRIARRTGVLVVEDAAQAHGAALHGSPVGALGDAACFSFYPTKNMTSGEGGMITTEDSETARMVRLLRNQGMAERYRNEAIGFNNRMTDIHAAIGRVQLRKLAGWNARRQANAAFLSENLRGVATPTEAEGAVHVYHQYTVRVQGHDRDRFAHELANRGVGSGVYYPVPVHELPAYGQRRDLPQTERAAREVISLPVHRALTDAELETIVTAVNEVAKAGA